MKIINVGRDFSEHPIGRYRSDGPESGEAFREDVLIPALQELGPDERITVILDDGVDGYGSSFLVEAFAGVVKVGVMEAEALLDRLDFQYTDADFEFFADKIRQYLQEADFGCERGDA
ncbi:STAS-like domain-containing protein [Alkalilimnicola sp. S0819]|uniref:STAS-like domain-containing protein n=1 Tax=Alkalilimnicola sp. S0819 TaxID=2613922 RepID=UPI00126204B3|nr:DUF4325 domain-containing protein [Alkalilimnicola sp. S0819]KAB7624129.1 DUF4325 domain-containing protein [Alkalilimnicola sp. S0819]MPQ16382.1 DUF4325 domain-containing protein [Alkalilimnicola sp. S0819]